MSEQRKHFPEFYVTAPQPCPYLPGRFERKLFTHLTHEKSPLLVDNLLRGGFRRSQNIAYMPYCEGCQGCVSVRVLVDEFKPSRSMRRVLDANRDLVPQRLQATPTSEQYSLFRSYIDERHAEGGMADMSVLDYAMMVEDSIIDTFMTEYRLGPQGGAAGRPPLVAVALSDRLSDGVSMVYSFYDPEATRRGLGTFMILDHIAHARRLGLPYVYLGYWIGGSAKMSYKQRFQPQERLTSGGWSRA
ncbi:MAG TPA: arginyltransferase [Hyphomicrobiaceae bacterium]|jgi:arginine-tRNA-protein transferase